MYINRLEFLVDYVKKGQVEIPEFVFEHDKELELRPLMDYGLEVDPLQYNDVPLGSTYPRHSLRYGSQIILIVAHIADSSQSLMQVL